MGTVSRLPERVRTPVPVLESESEAFDGVHSLIRRLSPANDGFASTREHTASLFAAIAGSGLLGITVPPGSGGADVSNMVLGEIVLAAASANRLAASWLASHFHSIELLRDSPDAGPANFFYGRALSGDLFLAIDDADAAEADNLILRPESARPGWRLNGSLRCTADAIRADWLVVRLQTAEGDRAAFIPRITSGMRLTPDAVSFANVHVDGDSLVTLAAPLVSTAGPVRNMLQSAQKLGWAERSLNDTVARQARPAARRRTLGTDYLSALGLTVSRIENGKAALERAGRRIDMAQVNRNEETVGKAAFFSAIALSSAAEAFDLATEIDMERRPEGWNRMDPYGHAPIGARLLDNNVH